MKKLKVQLQFNDGTSWIDLKDWTNISVTRNTDPTSNSMTVTLNITPRIRQNGTYTFQRENNIRLYAKHITGKDTLGAADLIFFGDIIGTSTNVNNKTISLTCVDYSYRFINRMVVQTFKASSGWTAPLILKRVLETTTDSEDGDGTTAITVNLVNYPNTNGVQQTRPDSSVFPTIDFATDFKDTSFWVDQISSLENTSSSSEITNGTSPVTDPYLFFINENNEAIWIHPSTTVSSTYDENDNNVLNITINDNALEEVSFLIIDCGTDNDSPEKQIHEYVFNENAVQGVQKDTFRARTDIAKTMKNEGLGSTLSVDEFRAEARRRARVYAEQEFKNKDGADSINLTLEGQQVQIGDVFSLTGDFVDPSIKYRIEGYSHSFSSSGYTVNIQAKEIRLQ